MLKQYIIGSHIFQYEEGEQPKGAVEYNSKKPEKKAEPKNKTRAVKNK